MIKDDYLKFADAEALDLTGTGEDLVGDVVDLGGVTNYPGNGANPLYLVILIDTTITSGGNATVQFKLLSDAQEAIAVDGSATQHFASAAIAKATLVAGYKVVCIQLPEGAYERYLGVSANIGTAQLTAGKIDAFLTKDPSHWVALPDAL